MCIWFKGVLSCYGRYLRIIVKENAFCLINLYLFVHIELYSMTQYCYDVCLY